MLRQTMNLRHLLIRNFRGIQHLDWAPGGKAICLIGAGDSTKTTILDAIEWSLSPRWSLPVSDADFHGAITDESIVVEATVGQVPGALLSDQKYGLDQRGWGADGSPLILPTMMPSRSMKKVSGTPNTPKAIAALDPGSVTYS